MAAPGIAAFGDGSHAPGATGIAVQGGGFGAFPGHVWIYQNADRTGSADELTVTAWNGVEATVNIPASLTNTAGTRYLFLQRADLAWSNAFGFTLEAASSNRDVACATEALGLTAQQASVGRARGVSATTQALALTGQSATIARNRAVSGVFQALAFTGHQATIGRGADRQVVAQTAALAFDEQVATVGRERGVLASASALALTGQAATIARDRSVLCQTGTLVLSAQQAAVIRGVLVSIVNARATALSSGAYGATVRAA